MGKSSGVALALISLLIGAGGLGIGAYSYFTFGTRIADLEERSIKGNMVRRIFGRLETNRPKYK